MDPSGSRVYPEQRVIFPRNAGRKGWPERASCAPARSGTPRSAPWYGRTRIGMALKKGLVAIDPSVIPFHTPLYIPGYGKALAADTGGGVRGKWIDLGYEDGDYQSWHWWVDVYVLEPRPTRNKILWVLPNYPPPSFPKKR